MDQDSILVDNNNNKKKKNNKSLCPYCNVRVLTLTYNIHLKLCFGCHVPDITSKERINNNNNNTNNNYNKNYNYNINNKNNNNINNSINNNNIVSLKNISIPNSCKYRKKINGEFQDCKNEELKWYIETLDMTVCDECYDYCRNFVDVGSITYQEYNNASFYINFGENISKFFKLNPQLNKEIIIKSIDIRNKFIFIDKNKISYGQKFRYVNSNITDKDPFLVVSFIGNTGSGKSCTVGSLCIESDNHPIPSYTNSESTSSDINSFIGEALINNEKKKYIILDSEGFGGTTPSVNKEDNNNISESTEDDINIQEIEQYRKEWVHIGYPRLLHIISDILVYTHGGSNKEKSNIIEGILNASEISSSNSNNLFKPHLIILLTGSNSSDDFKDLAKAKEDFFKSCKQKDVKKLELLYHSISVIYLSSTKEKGGLIKYINNIKTLNKLIGDKLNDSIKFKDESGFNFYMKANLNRIKKIINYLQRDPTGIPNLQLLNATGMKENISIQKILRNRSNEDGIQQSESHIFDDFFKIIWRNYLNTQYHQFIESGNPNGKSFEMAFNCLKSILLKIYKKYQKENGLDGDFIDDKFRMELDVISIMVSENSPCSELIKGKYECINFKHSHPYHQSNETETKTNSFLKRIFGSPRNYQVPYIAEGDYVGKLEKYDILSYLEDKVNSGQLSMVTSTVPILSLKDSIKDCTSFCTSCILKIPTIHYSCGHIICVSCSKESKQGECIFNSCNGQIINKKELDFDPAIGCRILSIDGSGVNSVSQCIALKIMKEQLYGIDIYQLFDLIVGVTTGGFIGLCLLTTKNDLSQLIKLHTDFIKWASELSFEEFLRKSDETLKNEIGNSPLKECYSKTRLLISSIKTTEESECEYELRNYNSVSNIKDYFDYNTPYNEAGTFLLVPCFINDRLPSISKSLVNSSSIAIDEYKSLWGHSCKSIDTFITLGSNVFSRFKFRKFLLLKEEFKSNLLLDELNITNKSILEPGINTFRISGVNKNEDYMASDNELNNNFSQIESIYLNDKSLFNSINKSLSSLFYLSNLNYSNNQLSGNIKCRLNSIPIEIIDQLNNDYDKFYLQDIDESNSEFQITSKEINNSNISISFIILNPSDIIDIRCSLVSKSGNVNKTSISSCPFSITQDLKHFIKN